MCTMTTTTWTEDDEQGKEDVTVYLLGRSLWSNRFGAMPPIKLTCLGKTLRTT